MPNPLPLSLSETLQALFGLRPAEALTPDIQGHLHTLQRRCPHPKPCDCAAQACADLRTQGLVKGFHKRRPKDPQQPYAHYRLTTKGLRLLKRAGHPVQPATDHQCRLIQVIPFFMNGQVRGHSVRVLLPTTVDLKLIRHTQAHADRTAQRILREIERARTTRAITPAEYRQFRSCLETFIRQELTLTSQEPT